MSHRSYPASGQVVGYGRTQRDQSPFGRVARKSMSKPRHFSDLSVGQKVLVEVECVFNEGLVVFCGSEGGSFCARGALLLLPAQNTQ